MCSCAGVAEEKVQASSSVAPTTDSFEETYAELRKWADVTSPKYLLLAVKREKRAGRLGSALKVCNFDTLEWFFSEIGL